MLSCLCSGQVSSDSGFYKPLIKGDGIRYPLSLSPAVWYVLGSLHPVRASDGLVHLAYVIQLTNHSSNPFTITSISVIDPDRENALSGTNQVVTILNEDVTAQVLPFSYPATLDKHNYSHVLESGQAGAVYFDVTYPDWQSVPKHLSHRIAVTESPGKSAPIQTFTAIDEPIEVENREPLVLSPPLKGPRWLDGNGCCKQIGPHRWVLTPVNGQIRPAEMFAIDFVQLDAHGLGYSGSVKDVKSFAYYEAGVYAVATGTVAEVVGDLPNAVPGANPPDTSVATAAGNHIIVDIGGNHYVMYAHLAPQSATVHVGDHVATGQLLGKLGNSGNTDSPHLHFQVMDRPSPLGAHGLPFVFDRMTKVAVYRGTMNTEMDLFLKGSPLLPNFPIGHKLEDAMPLTFDILNFNP